MNTFVRIVGAFLITSTFSLSSHAKKAQGVFTVVKGEVSILSEGKSKAVKARVGSKVHAKDIIEASKDSRAKIVMTDNNILNISPESKVELETYENDPESKSKKVMLNLMYGKVRSSVKQKYDGEKNVYRVKTPSAVAGVRGTDFIVDFNQNSRESQVITFEGVVQVASGINPSGALINPVAVRPGQFTFAKPAQAPQKAMDLPKSELAAMDKGSNADLANSSDNSANPNPPKNRKEPEADKAPVKSEPKKDSANPPARVPNNTPSGSMLPPPPPASEGIGAINEVIKPPSMSEFDQIQPINPSFNNEIVNQPRLPTDQIQDIINGTGRVIIRPIQQ